MRELLDNVSLFWSRYFEDYPVLVSLLDGATAKVSDIKLTNYSYLLSSGLDSCPITLTKDLERIELEDSNFIIVFGDPDLGTPNVLLYDLGVGTEIREIPYLSPSPDSDEFLECGVDFELFRGDSPILPSYVKNKLRPGGRYLQFSSDPREIVPKPHSDQQYFTGVYSLVLDTVPNGLEAGLQAQVYYEGVGTPVDVLVSGVITARSEIILSVGTPLPYASTAYRIEFTDIDGNLVSTGISLAQSKTHSGRTTSLWAITPKVDPLLLAKNYGHLHSTTFTESSELYRNFILGLTVIRNMPVTNKNIIAATCLCSGIPVFQSSYEEGDRIIRVDYSGSLTTVHTTLAKYILPIELTIRDEILNDAIEISYEGVTGTLRSPDHVQSFKFDFLDSIVSDVQVLEGNKSASSWWDRPLNSSSFMEIPPAILPREPLERRVIINHEYNNQIGNVPVSYQGTDYLLPTAKVGDYGVQIGDTTRNTVAYQIFKDFVRHHFTFVKISSQFMQHSEISAKPSILEDLQITIDQCSNPGTSIILGQDLDATLVDADGDSIPDIIDPEV